MVGIEVLEKVEDSMFVTESGIVTLVKLVQYSNAERPMLVTELPIVTLVRLSQS